MSSFEVGTSSTSIMRTSLNSHLLPFNRDHLEPKIITLSNDYDLERVFRDSLGEETSFSSLLYALKSNVGGEINRIEVSMSFGVLSKEEVQANLRRRESDK